MSKKDEDEANLAPVGPGRKQQRPEPKRLTSHVPIRFTREMADQIRIYADEDGMTVSAWVRHQIRKSLNERKANTSE